MSEFPFSVTIKPTRSDDKPQSIKCMGLLRSVRGKRRVYEALWGDRPVILKVFSDPIKAKYHMNREWRGLTLLQQRGLNSPTPLFKGRCNRLGWAVVTEKITDAVNVRQALDNTIDGNDTRQLLRKVVRELARQHSKGVLQRDLHMANFMIKGDETFALDPSQMRFISGRVGPRRSIAQLAQLASFAPEEDENTISMVCEEYARVRSCKFSESDMTLFSKELTGWIKKAVNRGVRKSLRTSKRYQRFNRYGHRGVAIRKFLENPDLGELAANIDNAMNDGHVLKNGNTCFVSHIGLAGKEVVVKRYNHKGIIHSLRHTIKGSRARRSWLHANRLTLLKVATPKPLAYFERRKGTIVWKSYFVTEHVKGQRLCDFLRDDTKSRNERARRTEQLREVLAKLHKYNITHGDLKLTNILVTDNGPVLTDLDAMKVHTFRWICRIKRRKDTARMKANMEIDRHKDENKG